MPKELLIIRHARSQHNVRETEHLNAALTLWGCQQARFVARYMRKHMDLKYFQFFTSPFERCLQTSVAIARELGVRFQVNQAWREYVNHSRQSVKIHRGRDDAHFYWSDFPEEVTYHDEFNEEFLYRIQQGCDSLPDKSVVVTHGLPALMLIHVATGRRNAVPIWDHSIDNASMSYIIDGQVRWHGRNLPCECDLYDPYDITQNFDRCDLTQNARA